MVFLTHLIVESKKQKGVDLCCQAIVLQYLA
jgi:hypothetical protein